MTAIIKTTEAAEITRQQIEFDRKLICEWLKNRLTENELYLLKTGEYKKQLANLHICEHIMSVTIFYRLENRETRLDPAEYAAKACCDECGEWMEVEDIPEGTQCNEDHGDKFRKLKFCTCSMDDGIHDWKCALRTAQPQLPTCRKVKDDE